MLKSPSLLSLKKKIRSLAFGINMPIRTFCFLGETQDLNTLMFQQMEGRCGRRGLDKKGTVIFAGRMMHKKKVKNKKRK